MTITSPRRHTPTGSGPTPVVLTEWTVVQSGLWVGNANGEFAGMIEERSGEGFIATTQLALTLGTFATIEEAKARFGQP